MKIRISLLAILVIVSACGSGTFNDSYLNSLRIKADELVAADSVSFDDLIVQPSKLVIIDDDWVLMSLRRSDNHLLFLNTKTGDYFPALRKGRGPGEIVQGNSLQRIGEYGLYYDLDRATCLRIDLKGSVRSHNILFDTLCVFPTSSRPVFLTQCGDGFISGNITDGNVWYSYYDKSGEILSSIKALEFDNLSSVPVNNISFMISSMFTSSPDGDMVCVANVTSPSLSFSKNENGKLTEYKRISFPPKGIVKGRMTPEHMSAFNGITSDKKFVYVIYSGNKVDGKQIPADCCRHLIIYDWGGNVRKHYILEKGISALSLMNGRIWGLSTYPYNQLFSYKIKL